MDLSPLSSELNTCNYEELTDKPFNCLLSDSRKSSSVIGSVLIANDTVFGDSCAEKSSPVNNKNGGELRAVMRMTEVGVHRSYAEKSPSSRYDCFEQQSGSMLITSLRSAVDEASLSTIRMYTTAVLLISFVIVTYVVVSISLNHCHTIDGYAIKDTIQSNKTLSISNQNLKVGYHHDLIPDSYTNEKLTELVSMDDVACRPLASPSRGKTECMGPPYLYISYHGGHHDVKRRVRNVCKYTRDGCPRGSVLLPTTLTHITALRGMILHNELLFLAHSYIKDSKILVYSKPIASFNHRRVLLYILAEQHNRSNHVLQHPYGLAFSFDHGLYVSTQGTEEVLRYNVAENTHNATAGSVSNHVLSTCYSTSNTTRIRNSTTFVSLSAGVCCNTTGPHVYIQLPKGGDVRGIALNQKGELFVSVKSAGVMVYDKSGFVITTLRVPSPISVTHDAKRGSIWVGSSKNDKLYEFKDGNERHANDGSYGCIQTNGWYRGEPSGFAFKCSKVADPFRKIQVIEHKLLHHPAGIVTYGDSLFVLSQRNHKLLEFDQSTGKMRKVVMDALPDDGEGIILSPD